jgi:hypothetical protein
VPSCSCAGSTETATAAPAGRAKAYPAAMR